MCQTIYMVESNEADLRDSIRDFKQLFQRHASSVCIVTLIDQNTPFGFTASSVISVSIDPCLVAFSVMQTSSSSEALSRVQRVGIHFLNREMSSMAAKFSESGVDRFESVRWEPRASVPYIEGLGSFLAGRISQRHDAGGSTIIVVEVEDVRISDTCSPLLYLDRSFVGVEALYEHTAGRPA